MFRFLHRSPPPTGMTSEEMTAVLAVVQKLSKRLDAIENTTPAALQSALDAHIALQDAVARAFERIETIEARLDAIEQLRAHDSSRTNGPANVHVLPPRSPGE